MESGKVLLGALVGVAVGTAIGVLLAPDKGAETRKKIAKKTDEYSDGLTEKFNGFVSDVAQKVENLKTKAARAAENGKQKVEELADNAATSAYTHTRNKIEELATTITPPVNNSKSKVW
jgi:gas vesicle protein